MRLDVAVDDRGRARVHVLDRACHVQRDRHRRPPLHLLAPAVEPHEERLAAELEDDAAAARREVGAEELDDVLVTERRVHEQLLLRLLQSARRRVVERLERDAPAAPRGGVNRAHRAGCDVLAALKVVEGDE